MKDAFGKVIQIGDVIAYAKRTISGRLFMCKARVVKMEYRKNRKNCSKFLSVSVDEFSDAGLPWCENFDRIPLYNTNGIVVLESQNED